MIRVVEVMILVALIVVSCAVIVRMVRVAEDQNKKGKS
jgi:hypothetical protein